MRNVDLFDEYLSGRISGKEKAEFEGRLNADVEFRNEFNMHKLFAGTIEHALAKNELKAKLNTIHEDEFGGANVISIDAKPSYLKVASVAASVSLLIFLSGFLIYRFGFQTSNGNQYEEVVKKVVEKMDDVRKGFEINSKLNSKAPANFEATGFAISSKGYFITSLHSVKNADSVMVLNDQFDYISADKVWEDENLDVAVFKLSKTDGVSLKELPIFFKQSQMELGEKVFAIGYPRETVVYSEGSISAGSGLNGDTTKYQLSLLINPGNSGSPVLDEQGSLVGIISGRNNSAQGVSYAVKAQYVYEMLKNIPDERLRKDIAINGKNSIKKLKRTEQIKKLKPFVFNIKVYKSQE